MSYTPGDEGDCESVSGSKPVIWYTECRWTLEQIINVRSHSYNLSLSYDAGTSLWQWRASVDITAVLGSSDAGASYSSMWFVDCLDGFDESGELTLTKDFETLGDVCLEGELPDTITVS